MILHILKIEFLFSPLIVVRKHDLCLNIYSLVKTFFIAHLEPLSLSQSSPLASPPKTILLSRSALLHLHEITFQLFDRALFLTYLEY